MPDLSVFRVFCWDPGVADRSPGGCLFFHRAKQGSGRHDSPADYGVFYCSSSPESAVAEAIQAMRGRKLADSDLVRFGLPLALVELNVKVSNPIDLDDPSNLLANKLKPSKVASPLRGDTQGIARDFFRSKIDAISWWSTLHSPWTNISILVDDTKIDGTAINAPRRLSVTDPVVRSAGTTIGVRF